MKLEFFRHFLRNPGTTGAVLPSSPALARMIVSDIDLDHCAAISELGPGTGAITDAVLALKAADAKFFAIELNPEIFADFIARYPGVKAFNCCAGELPEILSNEGFEHLDAVISGLPWAAFPRELQQRLLGAVCQVLAPDGVFVTFAYLQGLLLPAGQRFRRQLACHFKKVERSPVVWRNVPPAFVYRCRGANQAV